MTELEKKIAAKIPGEDTGIEVRKSICGVCAPAYHCGLDVYVKDGKLLKVEGTKGHPMNNGLLCTKGASNRAFIYQENRIKTPLRRVGPRGSGKFEPITWDEAYREIADRLNELKAKYGPESVAFFAGYEKWFRLMLQRFAYVFGSPNFGSESSACFTASMLGWIDLTGHHGRPDMAKSKLHLGWSAATHHSRYLTAKGIDDFKARGGKVIIVDPRYTPASQRIADLYLRVKPGTDGLLANGIAGVIIRNGWQDQEYMEKYAHGWKEYSDHVTSLDIEEVSRITTVPVELIEKAADMIAHTKPMSIDANPTSIIHQTNGYQTVRSIFALSVVTGNYDKAGGNVPMDFTFSYQGAGFNTREVAFETNRAPASLPNRIGAVRYPVWASLTPQMQAVDLPRQIVEETPYPIRGLLALGLNHRIFGEPDYFAKALEKLEFFVNVDPFWTDTCPYADLILPACTSFERDQMLVYPGGFAKYYTPVIDPVGEARPDSTILQDLANLMDLDDELLKGGYKKCIEWVFQDTGYDIDELIASPLPLKCPNMLSFKDLEYVERGCDTPSGKLELWSETIAKADKALGLNPLPVWVPNAVQPTEEYPFILSTGVRIPNAIHTRLHKVSWPRSLRPDPMADISLEDAARLGLSEGDDIQLVNAHGAITVKANPTAMVAPGQVYMFHGYSEADAGQLIGHVETDPYSGFPGFKCTNCDIRKV